MISPSGWSIAQHPIGSLGLHLRSTSTSSARSGRGPNLLCTCLDLIWTQPVWMGWIFIVPRSSYRQFSEAVAIHPALGAAMLPSMRANASNVVSTLLHQLSC